MNIHALKLARGTARRFIKKRGIAGTIHILESTTVGKNDSILGEFITDFVSEVTGKEIKFSGTVADLVHKFNLDPEHLLNLILDKDKTMEELIELFQDYELFPDSVGDDEAHLNEQAEIMVFTPIEPFDDDTN